MSWSLDPARKVLIGHTMYYTNEVRAAEEHPTMSSDVVIWQLRKNCCDGWISLEKIVIVPGAQIESVLNATARYPSNFNYVKRCSRPGGIVLEQHCWSDADAGPALAVRGASVQRENSAGIGYNFALHLVNQDFHAYGFNAGARPIDATQFVNQKAEAHWTFRSYRRKTSSVISMTSKTATQLSTPRRAEPPWGPGSPNRAESLVMACMRFVQQETTATYGSPNQISSI